MNSKDQNDIDIAPLTPTEEVKVHIQKPMTADALVIDTHLEAEGYLTNAESNYSKGSGMLSQVIGGEKAEMVRKQQTQEVAIYGNYSLALLEKLTQTRLASLEAQYEIFIAKAQAKNHAELTAMLMEEYEQLVERVNQKRESFAERYLQLSSRIEKIGNTDPKMAKDLERSLRGDQRHLKSFLDGQVRSFLKKMKQLMR